ncbi:MAG TPA: putative quinol monooxygenase [Kineosporiaceae bacterium]|nr:putative quinol monooxygenase [Kineosporiaceae bacterium]
MSIGVLATLRVSGDHAEDVRAALVTLAEQAAQEAGTELFEVHESTEQVGHFVVFERYRDQDAVLAHRTSEAMDRFREALRASDTRPEIVFLAPVALRSSVGAASRVAPTSPDHTDRHR